jgi:hypothetical protein
MNGTAQIFEKHQAENDPLEKVIVQMINAMQADYGQVFTKQFIDAEVLRNYKRRLYQKLRGLPVEAIIEGYELCVSQNLKFCPTIHEVVANVLEVVKRNKKLQANKVEAEQVATLPAPKIKCDPLAMLAKAKSVKREQETEEDRQKRKASLLQNHQAVLNLHSHKIKQIFVDAEHTCAVSNCNKPGALSSGLKGGSNWYCAKHFTSI